MAIGLRLVPYEEKHLKNHFFGSPLLPESMQDFDESVMFLGMVHLPDIASLDKENKLPHEGYLYFFLDTREGSRHLLPIVRYSKEEPAFIVDEFNDELAEDEYKGIEKPVGVEFAEVGDDDEGCKLLGVPCDWNYPDPPKTPLLLSLSHYDEGLSFLSHLDGYTYVFFGPKGHEYDGAYGFYEYS